MRWSPRRLRRPQGGGVLLDTALRATEVTGLGSPVCPHADGGEARVAQEKGKGNRGCDSPPRDAR